MYLRDKSGCKFLGKLLLSDVFPCLKFRNIVQEISNEDKKDKTFDLLQIMSYHAQHSDCDSTTYLVLFITSGEFPKKLKVDQPQSKYVNLPAIVRLALLC